MTEKQVSLQIDEARQQLEDYENELVRVMDRDGRDKSGFLAFNISILRKAIKEYDARTVSAPKDIAQDRTDNTAGGKKEPEPKEAAF